MTNPREVLTWYRHPIYGTDVMAISTLSMPCRGCGEVTHVRFCGHPAHHRCWAAAGEPGLGAASKPSDTAAADPAPAAGPARPTVVDQGGSGDTRGPHGQRSADRRFSLDNDEELHDWSREIRKHNPDVTDAQCAAALAAWHTHVTYSGDPVRFVSSPGYTGVAVYEWLTSRRGSMAKPEPLQSEAVLAITNARTTLQVLSYIDPDQPVTIGHTVTELDINAQYLAAARSAELGDGEPVEVSPVDQADHAALFRRPGYVQLGAAPTLTDLPPTARLPFARVDAGWWLPTPTARYLQHDHGVTLDITAGWTWPAGQHGRRLSVWAGVFATARAALTTARDAGDHAAALALQILKTVYATFLGGMTRSDQHNDRGTLRPDWHDQYVTQAGVNCLRALDKARQTGGHTPIGVMKDSAWFLSPTTGPITPEGLTISDQPGKWHINRWGAVTSDIVAAHQSGRIGTLRRVITAADNARKAAA